MKYLKFGTVGLIGALLNLTIFYIGADVIQMNYNLVAVVAFAVSVLGNYFLNHSWTFREENEGKAYCFSDCIKYIAINIIGLLVNMIVLNLIILMFDPHLRVVAQIFGIGAGGVVNYLGAKRFVFVRG
jgi:putative flippase GtrA